MKFATPFNTRTHPFLSPLLSLAQPLKVVPALCPALIVQSWPGPADLPVRNLFSRHLALGGGSGGPVQAFSFSGGPVQNISLLVLTESFCWSVQGRLQHGGGCQWFGSHTMWKMAKPLLNYLCDAIADILWCLQWKPSSVFWSVWACCYRIQVVYLLQVLKSFYSRLKGRDSRDMMGPLEHW
jgi:hypothetical protein